nr:MAG TPA: hypothetical protein [Caudoviricetes sp.]
MMTKKILLVLWLYLLMRQCPTRRVHYPET